MEHVNKIAKFHDNQLENEEQVKVDDGGERDENELSDMDKLPPEMVMMILNNLEEQELVKCRLLSSRWNEICCLLLQDKSKNNPKSKLAVKLSQNNCTTIIRKPIDAFLKCFSPSEAKKSSGRRHVVPFSTFIFRRLKDMDLTQVCEFLSTFGAHMKTVTVIIDKQDIANFKKLWRLLLHFAPNVQHLRIIGGSSLAKIVLIDPLTKLIAKTDPTFKTQQFYSLKVLEVISANFGEFNDFMKDILYYAPHLKEVVSSNPLRNSFDLKHFEAWNKLNRAHLVQKLEIKSTSKSYYSPAELMKNLQLEYLKADCNLENEREIFGYIYHALKSSQTTLTSLNLNNLTMESMNLCFKDIKSLPNVRQLKIQIQNAVETGNIFEKISQLCPNVTNLIVVDRLYGDFSKVAPILWTGFKGLKSLKFNLDMDNEGMDFLIVDSGFSGYSNESIDRIFIRQELNGGFSLEEARQNVPQNPSILDLKGLSRLELEFWMGGRTKQKKNVENELRRSFFIKILPQHIRENFRSISYCYLD